MQSDLWSCDGIFISRSQNKAQDKNYTRKTKTSDDIRGQQTNGDMRGQGNILCIYRDIIR